jgi:hypothetical protein
MATRPGAAVHSAVLSTTGKGRIMIKPQAGSRDYHDGCDRRLAMPGRGTGG